MIGLEGNSKDSLPSFKPTSTITKVNPYMIMRGYCLLLTNLPELHLNNLNRPYKIILRTIKGKIKILRLKKCL